MFDINSIVIYNFKSYSGKHHFNFPKEPGLYHLTGENLYNPRLEANGAGKTSLIDAVQWCLYGSSTRGLKAGDIITWGKKKAKVTTFLKIKNKTREISRGQNPNFIKLDGKIVTQDELNNVLKLDKDSFNFAIVIPQFNESFFELKPTTKLNMFSQLMNLNYWIERSADAIYFANRLNDSINTLTNDIHNIKSTIENINFDISSLKDKKKVFNEEKKAHINQLKIQQLETSNLDKELKTKLNKLRSQIKKASGKQKASEEAINKITIDITRIEKSIMHQNNDINNLNLKSNDLKYEFKNIKELRGNFCPVCGQHVNKEYVTEHLKPIKVKIKNLKIAKTLYIKNIEGLEWAMDVATKAIKINEKKYKEVTVKLDKKKSKQDELNYTKRTTLKRYDDLTQQIQTEKERENPFDDLLKTKQFAKTKHRKLLKHIKINKLQAKKEFEAINFWSNGFKRVRLFIIEQTLRSLEIEINNNFIALGLIDWSVTFDIERETKAGGISRGFNVFIKSPKYKKPIRWESWSGGETQRLKIAGDLGLANLILEHNNIEGQIEFHDEPSTHMTSKGINDMVETLYQRAHNLGKKIWLVDHQTINFGGFSGVLKVTMNEKGISKLKYLKQMECQA